MPYYQVEIFRTTQDTATLEVQAPNEQQAEQIAGQSYDLDWNVQEEHFTFSTTLSSSKQGYTSMTSLLAQQPLTQPTSGYVPLVNP